MSEQLSSVRGQQLLEKIARIPVIVQGKVSERRSGGKVTGCKLQRWRGGRNETRHIPAALVETVRQGTRGYAHLMELVQEYVDLREADAFRLDLDSKKKPTKS